MRVGWVVVWVGLWLPVSVVAAQEDASALGAADSDSDSDSGADSGADSDAVRLRVLTDTPGYGLSRYTESSYRGNPLASAVVDIYERLCLAPCETTLPAGRYRLAVDDRGTHYPIGERELLEDSDLYLSLDRPRAQRAVGVLMILGGLAAALTFFGRVVVKKDEPERHDSFIRDVVLGSVGGALFFTGIITLVFAETRAQIRIGPRE